MAVSGFTLARYSLRSTNIGRGILQLITGITLLIGGVYTTITAV